MNYELTDETIKYDGRTLYRIKALVDIPYHGVKAGDLGGFIEKVENLQGDAWVSGNARVYGYAQVYGNAQVYDNAAVFDDAWVCDAARVCGDAKVYGDTRVRGNAEVSGNEPEVKEDNPHIIPDQLLADLKLAACQFEQAHREWIESVDYVEGLFTKLLQARTALENAARAYAKQFNSL